MSFSANLQMDLFFMCSAIMVGYSKTDSRKCYQISHKMILNVRFLSGPTVHAAWGPDFKKTQTLLQNICRKNILNMVVTLRRRNIIEKFHSLEKILKKFIEEWINILLQQTLWWMQCSYKCYVFSCELANKNFSLVFKDM